MAKKNFSYYNFCDSHITDFERTVLFGSFRFRSSHSVGKVLLLSRNVIAFFSDPTEKTISM